MIRTGGEWSVEAGILLLFLEKTTEWQRGTLESQSAEREGKRKRNNKNWVMRKKKHESARRKSRDLGRKKKQQMREGEDRHRGLVNCE